MFAEFLGTESKQIPLTYMFAKNLVSMGRERFITPRANVRMGIQYDKKG